LKNINFQKVQMENYCGYIDLMEFCFENNKIIMISGKNGVGKSTVFSAIPFALYGVTQTGQRADDVLNKKTEKNCKVICYFSIDNIEYRVERYVKYTKLGTTALLYKNNNPTPISKGAKEVSNKIEELIVPRELFLNTILFGQKVKSFFTDLPDSKQKEIFRKILQLDSYVTYQKTAFDKISLLKEDLINNKNEVNKLKASIDSFNFSIEQHNNNLIIKNNDIDTCKQINIDLENQLSVELEILKNLHINELQLKYDNFISVLNSYKNELQNIQILKESKISDVKSKTDLKLSQLREIYLEKKNEEIQNKNNSQLKTKSKSEEELSKLRKNISESHEIYLNEKNSIINENRQHIEETKISIIQKIEKLKENRIILKNDLIDGKVELVNENNDILAINKEKNVMLINKINLEIKDKNSKLVKLESDKNKCNTKIEFINSKICQYILSIESQTSICPTCFQSWDNVDHVNDMIKVEELIVQDNLELLKIIDNDILIIQNNIDILNTKIDDLYVKSDIFKENLEKEHINKINFLKNTYDKNDKNILEKIENFQSTIDNSIATINEKFNIMISNLENGFSESDIKLQNQILLIEEQLQNTFSQIDNNFQKEIVILSERLEKAKIKVNELMTINITELNENFNLQKSKLSTKLKETEKEFIILKHELAKVESIKNRISNIENDITGNKQTLKSILTNISEIKIILKEINDKILEQKVNISKYVNDINVKQKNLSRCEFWKTAFSSSGIPSMLIDESIPFMNLRISQYLEQMSNGRYIVTFDTLHETKSGEFRDKISIHVYDADTHSDSRVNLSGGQTKLVDIATILTLSDLQENVQHFQTNILLFDEIFDALDDENIANVSNMLRRILTENKSINIITHRHIDQVEADIVYNLG